MKKGALEYCVLALLLSRAQYGFELAQSLGRMDGMITSEGTIYPLLSRLARDGLVETEWQESTLGPPRKYYRTTEQGRRALTEFSHEWQSFRAAVDRILEHGDVT